MTESFNHSIPGCYKLRVSGHLPDRWEARFQGLTLRREDNGTTSICGEVLDQAALHGLLTRIRDLGVVLISVEAVFQDGRSD